METQQVEAYPAYYTGYEGKLDKAIEKLRKASSNNVPLRWSWEKAVGGLFVINCTTESINVAVSMTVSDKFLELLPVDDLVPLLQSEFSNKIGRMIVAPGGIYDDV